MAHTIKGHPKCGNIHGHSYNATFYLFGDDSYWLDFADIKKNVDNVIDTIYDHQFHENISCERLAGAIGDKLFRDYYYSGYIELFETSKYGVKRRFGKPNLKEI